MPALQLATLSHPYMLAWTHEYHFRAFLSGWWMSPQPDVTSVSRHDSHVLVELPKCSCYCISARHGLSPTFNLMDLFHALTQEIENVISCHWLNEFKQSGRGRSNSSTPSTSRTQSAAPDLSKSTSRSTSRGSSADRTRSGSIADLAAEKANMSSNMMDTEKGGESTQYESIHTVTKPHSKQSGQLGG